MTLVVSTAIVLPLSALNNSNSLVYGKLFLSFMHTPYVLDYGQKSFLSHHIEPSKLRRHAQMYITVVTPTISGTCMRNAWRAPHNARSLLPGRQTKA